MPRLAPLIADARAFNARLKADNSRAFFTANKAEYDAKLKAPAQAMLAALTPRLAEASGHPVTAKLFRPQRDVRFSKDRTPYNTHLHMMWILAAGGRRDPVAFLGIGEDYLTAGLGVMEFDPEALARWRSLCDLDQARMTNVTGALTAQGFDFAEPELKRVPAPHDIGHPMADFLRMKSFRARKEISGGDPLEEELLATFTTALPVLTLLAPVL